MTRWLAESRAHRLGQDPRDIERALRRRAPTGDRTPSVGLGSAGFVGWLDSDADSKSRMTRRTPERQRAGSKAMAHRTLDGEGPVIILKIPCFGKNPSCFRADNRLFPALALSTVSH
jgi:hypothetical protein